MQCRPARPALVQRYCRRTSAERIADGPGHPAPVTPDLGPSKSIRRGRATPLAGLVPTSSQCCLGRRSGRCSHCCRARDQSLSRQPHADCPINCHGGDQATATVTTRECQFCHSEPLFMFSAEQQKQVKEKGGFIVPMPA
ncbi:MAG: DUF2024 family protein [Nitrospira sp.]|nr:DUF2024 family protein [Nitrospira sp.]